jgi:GTP-binding protein
MIKAQFIKGIKGDDAVLNRSNGQVAFFGRSNVGKSSVINSLVGKKIAFSSNTPGRTQEINVFDTDQKFTLLDFPGYGYARVPAPIREKLRKMILWYVGDFKHDKRLFVLVIDSNVGLTDYDKEMLGIFTKEKHNYLVVSNKSDKLNQSKKAKLMQQLNLEIDPKSYILYSATKKDGKKELVEYISKNL